MIRVGDYVSIVGGRNTHLDSLQGREGIVIADKGNEFVVRLVEDDVMNGVVGALKEEDLSCITYNFNCEEYAQFVASRLKPLDSDAENLLHCGVGCATEAGELLSTVKKVYFYGKQVDREVLTNIEEELGDILFYLVGACNQVGLTLDEVALANQKKLTKRYPKGYSDSDALARADKEGTEDA